MVRFLLLVFCYAIFVCPLLAEKALPSSDTQTCIDCHGITHPGIVKDWESSLHSKISPEKALLKDASARRVTSKSVPENLLKSTVGCAECHGINNSRHGDSFEHNGYDIHIVVTPGDCAVCHTEETGQYEKNLMANAHGNLVNNPLYMDLADSINGIQSFDGDAVMYEKPDVTTNEDSCLYCHGTVVKVTGTVKKETNMGEMSFPRLSGWPNQGVGRINPDGTKGSCASCHTRHSFPAEIARKPYTCSECHKGPDVPAYKVYSVSKHGNIFSSKGKDWDFKASPWTVGKDFTAPTCAVCHVSGLVNSDGDVIAKRTHQMNDRISWRLFGIIYAHPHPASPDTSIIKNRSGLTLPTELTGEPVSEYLIDGSEQKKRRDAMTKICASCHAMSWVEGHFARYEKAIKTTNKMTLTATKILLEAWEKGAAKGPSQKDSVFNETLEKMWVEQWLFYANTVRYASAMAGADYGVFANGRWNLSRNIQEMKDWLDFKLKRCCPSRHEGKGCAASDGRCGKNSE